MSKPSLDDLVVTDHGDAAATDLEIYLDGCRILAHNGHARGLAGQLTLRDGESTRFHTLPLGVGFDEAGAEHVLLVDEDVNTLRGAGRANPANRFHSWIYRRHPAVKAIVHTHSPAMAAFSMLGMPMPVAHMDAAMFYDDISFVPTWPGVPTGDDEGKLISAGLGGRRSVLLVNHGIVCTGASLKEAVYLHIFAEWNARACLDALAAGSIQPIDPQAGREAHDLLLHPTVVGATFDYWARQARRG